MRDSNSSYLVVMIRIHMALEMTNYVLHYVLYNLSQLSALFTSKYSTTVYFILLGKETAIKLASLGADIIILCRNPEKAEEAVADIKRESGFTSVRYGIPAHRYFLKAF